MKSLDERISSLVSPFDEDLDQDNLLYQQHIQYQKDSILESIGTKRAKIEFDIHLEELLEKLQKGSDYSLFLEDCLKKLSEEFYLDVLIDYIQRRSLLTSEPDKVLDLLKYFVYEKWLDDVVYCLPEFDVSIFNTPESIQKILTESFLTIQNNIIGRDDVNPLVHFYFTYCSENEGLKTIMKMVIMDLPGIISIQLIRKLNKGIKV